MTDSQHPTPAMPFDDISTWTLTELLIAAKSRVFPPDPDSLTAEHLRLMPTRQLRVLINQTFKTLELPHPPHGARNRYTALSAVLQEREHEATRSA